MDNRCAICLGRVNRWPTLCDSCDDEWMCVGPPGNPDYAEWRNQKLSEPDIVRLRRVNRLKYG